MARATRIDLVDGWYHVTARGNERRAIFRGDPDRQHFLELLGDWVELFGLRLHAYVLMDNHYHLLVQTPLANLSVAMQWLGVSYSVWFNRRHRREGHLFQGRFKGIVLEEVGVAAVVSAYLHLNPVRVQRLGLDRAGQARSRQGLGEPPAAVVVAERLNRLRTYRWSSYRAYAGLVAGPPWLEIKTVLGTMGDGRRSLSERQRRYAATVADQVREGMTERPWERLTAGLVLGGAEFVQGVRGMLTGNRREQPAIRRLEARPGIEAVKAAVEAVKGERWEAFRDRYGDWGRDVVLYLGRKRCGLKLRELSELAGGIDDATVGMAVKRWEARLRQSPALVKVLHQVEGQMLNVGM